MSRRKCPLCQNPVGEPQGEKLVRKAFPDAEITPGVGPTALDEHMMFQHGFTRAHSDNTSGGVAEAYYRILSEPIEINGRTFNFGDYVEFKKGKLTVHAPGGIYADNQEVQTTHIVKTTIWF